MRSALFAIAALMLASAGRAGTPDPAAAQTAAQASGQSSKPERGSSAASPPPAAAPGPPAPEAYTYNPEGRRDPFLSLLGTGGGDQRGATSRRNDGPAGILVAEISVRGVMASRGGLIAMIQGPDNKTYIVHAGDKLLDGTIKSVTPQGLIVVQEVNDPLSLVKQREVPKLLRSIESARP
jgi:Tfp pilus assembly protein PilP